MNKDDFLIELEDIKQLASQFTVSDFMNFFHKVIENRKQQILKSNSDHGMLLYVWFDWQASRLKFNLISQVHERLPFIEIIDELEPIINEFLHFSYHDGFVDFDRELDPVKVFLISLQKK
ncbi:hypothetical protein ABEX29_10635 [Brevibacillus porteri]|uniref:hypothetical protein n=1 Tax=Brevibacillus porteri TaxID=2126350 RepID=UPI003D1FF939